MARQQGVGEDPRLDLIPDESVFGQAMLQSGLAVTLASMRHEDEPLVFVNAAFEALTGYSAQEAIGRNCRFLQGEQTDASVVAEIRRAIAEQDVAVVELVNYTKSGKAFVNSLHLGPVYDEAGELIYFFGSQWDITDKRDLKDELSAERSRAEQLSHRIRNLLSVVNGIIGASTQGANAELGKRLIQKILALSRAYEHTFECDANDAVDLRDVMRSLLEPYSPADEERLSISGRSLRVPQTLLATLAVTFHELASAALLHGALSQEGGIVDVSWRTVRIDGAQQLELLWSEETVAGVGERIATADESHAHGMIKSFVAAASGSLQVEQHDRMLEVRATFPLEREQFP